MPTGIYKRTEKHYKILQSNGLKGQFEKGHKGFWRGKRNFGRSITMRGEKNWNWKGSKVGYGALHTWIRNKLGNPQTCKHCGNPAKHWANKSGRYLRNINDWISLCVSCHKKYDSNKIYA